jgi:hypothetical protein
MDSDSLLLYVIILTVIVFAVLAGLYFYPDMSRKRRKRERHRHRSSSSSKRKKKAIAL